MCRDEAISQHEVDEADEADDLDDLDERSADEGDGGTRWNGGCTISG